MSEQAIYERGCPSIIESKLRKENEILKLEIEKLYRMLKEDRKDSSTLTNSLNMSKSSNETYNNRKTMPIENSRYMQNHKENANNSSANKIFTSASRDYGNEKL